ncbi:DNA-directed DNA polymerase [Tanacetum coccineum]
MIVLAVASSGIASLLLPVGWTAHSRFVIPLELMENSTYDIKQNTQLAELMQEIRNVESIVDITELFRKFKFICHWANPFKDFERSNVPRVKLSSFSKSDDTFTSLQALSNLHYLFSGFMDYFSSQSGREMTVTIRDDRYWHSMSFNRPNP